MNSPTRQAVFRRANHRCEYCQTARRLIGMPLVIDHVLPTSLGGTDTFENTCAACYRCNEFKGARTHGLDPATSELVPLYDPRRLEWHDHFDWANGGTHIIGTTPTGRATVITLRLNNEYLVESRQLWLGSGWHPPSGQA